MITKKLITEMTLRRDISTPDDVRFFKVLVDSEGAGRWLNLKDHTDQCLFFHHPDEILAVYEAAKQLWEQGSIYAESEDW